MLLLCEGVRPAYKDAASAFCILFAEVNNVDGFAAGLWETM
jgi:hypothetical protein